MQPKIVLTTVILLVSNLTFASNPRKMECLSEVMFNTGELGSFAKKFTQLSLLINYTGPAKPWAWKGSAVYDVDLGSEDTKIVGKPVLLIEKFMPEPVTILKQDIEISSVKKCRYEYDYPESFDISKDAFLKLPYKPIVLIENGVLTQNPCEDKMQPRKIETSIGDLALDYMTVPNHQGPISRLTLKSDSLKVLLKTDSVELTCYDEASMWLTVLSGGPL